MKKVLFICAFVLAAGAVFAAPRASRALAELNGRGSQIKFEELTVEGMQPVKVADIPGKGEYYNIHSVDLTGEWKTFSISFVPTGKSFIFSFAAVRPMATGSTTMILKSRGRNFTTPLLKSSTAITKSTAGAIITQTAQKSDRTMPERVKITSLAVRSLRSVRE